METVDIAILVLALAVFVASVGMAIRRMQKNEAVEKEFDATIDNITEQVLLLSAAFKETVSDERQRAALRGAWDQDWFRTVMQVVVAAREREIRDAAPADAGEVRAFREGKIAALDWIRTELAARVRAANKD